MDTISRCPLVQLCDVGEVSAMLVFKPAEVDAEAVLETAKHRVQHASLGAIRLRVVDLEFGLLQLYRRPADNGRGVMSLANAAELVAKELARTCTDSPHFDAVLYDAPA